MHKEEYNSEPVHYCKHCLSLRVMRMDPEDDTICYCDECGSTDIETANIHVWELLHKARYNN